MLWTAKFPNGTGGPQQVQAYSDWPGNPLAGCPARDTCSYWDSHFGGAPAQAASHSDAKGTELPLTSPVVSLELVAAVNSDPQSTWRATGQVERFQAMTRGEARDYLRASRQGIASLPRRSSPLTVPPRRQDSYRRDDTQRAEPEPGRPGQVLGSNTSNSSLPESYDFRSHPCAGSVMDQGWCGSC